MSEIGLDAIKARANAATPGPWLAEGPCENCGRYHAAEARFEREVGEYGTYLAYWHPAIDGCEGAGREHDADFIAHTRTDIPALIAEVERLQGELNAARDDVHDALLVAEQAEENAARFAWAMDHPDEFRDIWHAAPNGNQVIERIDAALEATDA